MKDMNNVVMNFAGSAVPMNITNSQGDTIIVSVDPQTQNFNIVAKEGNPIINVNSDNNKLINTIKVK